MVERVSAGLGNPHGFMMALAAFRSSTSTRQCLLGTPTLRKGQGGPFFPSVLAHEEQGHWSLIVLGFTKS